MHKSKRPYTLPKNIEISSDYIMNYDLIEECINKHRNYLQRYLYLENLYNGFHDVYHKPNKENWKPDNRLAVNFPRYITDTFTGYGYGIPISIKSIDDRLEEAIDEFNRYNEITDHNMEMVKMCCIYGHAYEYLYQNEFAKTKISAISPTKLFVVYDDKLNGKALFAIRYGYHLTKENEKVLYGEVLLKDRTLYFDNKKIIDEKINPYGLIPCVEWKLNNERLGLYENVTGLVETYNNTIGEKANDVDAFAEAYLAILGAELDEEGIYKIRDNRIINLYGSDNAKDVLVHFLQKPTADGTQENLLNRLENLIYQTSMVANISDESFGNSASGIALAYKLQAMSNLALNFDRKIEKSLRKRIKIFCSIPTNYSDKEAYQNIDVQMTRNIPKNISEEVSAAQGLSGIVSHETQLSILTSLIPDVNAEIRRIDKERESIISNSII